MNCDNYNLFKSFLWRSLTQIGASVSRFLFVAKASASVDCHQEGGWETISPRIRFVLTLPASPKQTFVCIVIEHTGASMIECISKCRRLLLCCHLFATDLWKSSSQFLSYNQNSYVSLLYLCHSSCAFSLLYFN